MTTVRRLRPGEWRRARALRLRALADAPGAFASTPAREQELDEDAWRARLAGAWFVAERDGRAVGLACGIPEPDDPAGRHLVGMWVEPAERGHGVADDLVDAVLGWARDDGAVRIALWVVDGNPRARRCYERRGFTPTGERQPLPSDPSVTESRMTRGLGPFAATDVDDAGVATLTITGAKSANVLSSPVVADLLHVVRRWADRDDLRALVLRGTGDAAFVAGADVGEMAELDPGTAAVFIDRLRRLCEAVRLFPVPVVARLPGWTLGAGLELAMCADLRVAADDARLGMPEVAVGIPSVIHAALLPRLVGHGRASRMLLTGTPVDAGTALAWGLVDDVVPLGALDERVEGHARHFAGLGRAVLVQQKRLLRAWEGVPVADAARASVAEFADAFTTDAPRTAMRRFLDRERPQA
ncbi:enoyl-CoA hydratase [Actinomycetospora chlora]|uniref:enoyl-CoA hydratase n=1 Tax=Actinomycetospora chlora TaxID=663608 RepID=UPI0031EF2FC9